MTAATGEGPAFRLLYDRYAARGFRYVHTLLRNVSDAEEVVQEAFCRLFTNQGPAGVAIADLDLFGAVFFKTLRNLSINTLRRRRLVEAVPLDAVPELPAPPVARRSSDELPLEARVRALMNDLPDSYAEALELRVIGGLSYDQISEVLGCTHAQVRTWIHRARRRLSAALDRPPEGSRNDSV